jgi:hypothetical protein
VTEAFNPFNPFELATKMHFFGHEDSFSGTYNGQSRPILFYPDKRLDMRQAASKPGGTKTMMKVVASAMTLVWVTSLSATLRIPVFQSQAIDLPLVAKSPWLIEADPSFFAKNRETPLGVKDSSKSTH